jgi:hypothetical protein
MCISYALLTYAANAKPLVSEKTWKKKHLCKTIQSFRIIHIKYNSSNLCTRSSILSIFLGTLSVCIACPIAIFFVDISRAMIIFKSKTYNFSCYKHIYSLYWDNRVKLYVYNDSIWKYDYFILTNRVNFFSTSFQRCFLFLPYIKINIIRNGLLDDPKGTTINHTIQKMTTGVILLPQIPHQMSWLNNVFFVSTNF